MPNIIELTKSIIDTKTTLKIKVRNYEGTQESLDVILLNADTGEFQAKVSLGKVLAATFINLIEQEIIKIKDYEGQQTTDTVEPK